MGLLLLVTPGIGAAAVVGSVCRMGLVAPHSLTMANRPDESMFKSIDRVDSGYESHRVGGTELNAKFVLLAVDRYC